MRQSRQGGAGAWGDRRRQHHRLGRERKRHCDLAMRGAHGAEPVAEFAVGVVAGMCFADVWTVGVIKGKVDGPMRVVVEAVRRAKPWQTQAAQKGNQQRYRRQPGVNAMGSHDGL